MIPDQDILINFFGPAGLIISALIGVIIYLQREVKSERKLNAELQEKRFADIQVYNSGIEKHRESTEKLFDDYKAVVEQLKFTVSQLGSK